MRAILLVTACLLLVITQITASAVSKRSHRGLQKRKYETSMEIRPGSVTFPNPHKEFDTETKILNPPWQEACCCCPCYNYPGYPPPYARPSNRMKKRKLITPIINRFTKQRFSIPPTLFQVFIWLGYGNSFLNPLIYALFNREFRLPFIYILRFQCGGINTRLRTETFSHQFGLPHKSGVGYCNSLSRGNSIASGSKRQRRQKPRGLSPLTNSQIYTSPSTTSQVVEAPNVEAEKPPLRSISNPDAETSEEPKPPLIQPSSNLPSPLHLTPLQISATSEKDDLLENNPPRPSQLMSRRESLASTQSNYDTYIPNLNAEFQRSPLPTPSSAPACLTPTINGIKMWTKARDFRPNQVPPERFHRQSEITSCTGVKGNSSNNVAANPLGDSRS
eukprot:TsM_000305600 transcript=TsM_000305600 gene=TsM_000305600